MSNPYTDEYRENEYENRPDDTKKISYLIKIGDKEEWVSNDPSESEGDCPTLCKEEDLMQAAKKEQISISCDLESYEEEELQDEPTDYEMITNNSVGICYHDGCM